MKTWTLRLLITSALLTGLAQTVAEASVFTTLKKWGGTGTDEGPVILGDKIYTLLSYNGNWHDDDVVRFDQSFFGSIHTVQFLDVSSGNMELEYRVDITSGAKLIKSIGLSVDWTFQPELEIVKTIYDAENNEIGVINFKNGTLTTPGYEGPVPGVVSFELQNSIRIKETILQSTNEDRINSMSNTITQVIPEPSTWLLSAFAAGG